MSFSLTISCISLSSSPARDGGPDLVIGPLKVWLDQNMVGLAWSNRFDLICDRTAYRPEGGQWFQTWQESPEERGGYFLGSKWNLLTGSRVMKGDIEQS